ncbi:class I SAM-dependent methyltransferase [Floridanema evergladense]|uniref:Class I SAM-dependent methyltransferase n=1 Tax=Floridaenema evergladense BLCC-F167 TaxID=3153639 RepID=A0ABV4WFI5_9CYAN
MDEQALDSLEKVRQQFDAAPYPRIPLEDYPNDMKYLTLYNMATAYYLRAKKVVETEGKVILDAGCGTGFKSLALAVANPGAKIVGVDLSEESVKLAKERLKYHGIKNVEFYPLSIYDLSKLGREFDYIHCDETLYLLPDIVAGLQAMKSVLKPEGIIRANLHSSRVRADFYAAQKLFDLMGLMNQAPGEPEIEKVRETMKALKNNVSLKVNTWKPQYENDPAWYLANYLLEGDRGYTIPEMFAALRAADLEFISMVNWPFWDIVDLLEEPDRLPPLMATNLPNLSVEQKLHTYELLNPIHRLIDFWCGHPGAVTPPVPLTEWTDREWLEAWVYIHPSLKVPQVKKEMIASVVDIKLLEMHKYLAFSKDPSLMMDSAAVATLLPLTEEPQSVESLWERSLMLRPINPASYEASDRQTAFKFVKELLISLEQLGFVFIERRAINN